MHHAVSAIFPSTHLSKLYFYPFSHNLKFTLTLHKFLSSGIADMRETVVFSEQMLDAGYLMLEI
jgi:hypothetical protein